MKPRVPAGGATPTVQMACQMASEAGFEVRA